MALITPVTTVLRKVFGSRNDRMVKSYRRRVEFINALEPQIRPLTDEQLRDKAAELRRRIADGTPAAEVMYEAFAVMRESLDRNVGIRNIFNPEHKSKFDVAKLPSHLQSVYRKLEEQIAATAPGKIIGQVDDVPPFLQVDIPVELYEAVRELYPESRPFFRCRPFDVQLIGGMVLYEGKIAEMKTGEGKTIVAPLACFMAVTEGLQCHVVTVNDYLVQRDRDWVFPAFYRLGITIGAIHPYHVLPEHLKKQMYECDIVYGTNSEFGFDYLRDNMKLSLREQVQRKRDFCIVDEIDSILIDEARTPLIISGPAHDGAPQYVKANEVAERLTALQRSANTQTTSRIRAEGFVKSCVQPGVPASQIEKIIHKFKDLGPDYLDEKEAGYIGHTQYYVVKREQKQANMTPLGVEEAQKIVGTRFYVVGNDMAWDHLINQAIRAHAIYEKDREYVVQNGEVIIVDEFTGRLMIGRQWSDGLHQAVEAKESRHGVKIKQETQTLATITIQNFFKLYKRLAGMTGTAVTESTEFMEIYDLDCVCIPTNVPVVREDRDDLIYLTEGAKWKAIIEEIREKAEAGRPVLVGTTSVEKSQMLSELLTKKYGLDHEVLNAKQHEREAHIVEKAGQRHVDNRGRTIGNVTIATNMAGRGTDIKLAKEVREAGGLHIVGTERHEARRIDNQLRGRAGRQGDPGSSRFFISMEDDLMKMFAGKSTMKALSMLGMQEDDAIEHRWITKSVERAQRKVEERNYEIRKNLLEYDEVMEYQRNTFYATRQAVLEDRRIRALVLEYLSESIDDAVASYYAPDYVPTQVSEAVRAILNVSINPAKLRGENIEDVRGQILSDAKADARQDIEISVGEFMSDDIDPADWDLKGLSQWAMSRFSVDLKINKLRESNPKEVMDHMTEVAHELIDRKPMDALSKFYESDYAASELAAWARNKFGLELTVDEIKPGPSERLIDAQKRVAGLIRERAFEAYRRREIDYPINFVLEMVFSTAQQGAEGTAWAADQLSRWANQRFDLGWSPEVVTKMNGEQLHRSLREAGEAWRGPKIDAWLDQTLNGRPDDGTVRRRVAERWGIELGEEDLAAEDRKEMLRERVLTILRLELTQLEQYVLLQILDQNWKDHLYAMDQLKDAIGLRGFAEKDPKIEYKAEGSRMFHAMLRGMRDKVTDLIFKAKLTANVQMRSVYHDQKAEHESPASTGVSAAAAASGTDEQRADLEAARRAGSGDRQVTETIVNTAPQVGRNDPCPCGSGKKYKKCCGASL
ncbi:MAG: hypothetical protein GC162_02410 [Planctomycetes bacterium]|nr:hypothetical protein [Planctomycetota bacterium]